jgi:hypothetical protein
MTGSKEIVVVSVAPMIEVVPLSTLKRNELSWLIGTCSSQRYGRL